MAEPSSFRGYWAIKEAVDRMAPLAMWFKTNRPSARAMTLDGRDFDLIKRWPKAAEIHKVAFHEDGRMFYEGFELRRDHKPERYPRTEKGAVS